MKMITALYIYWTLHSFLPSTAETVSDISELSRSSRPKVFFKKGILKNFAKVTGKHLYQSLFFNKVAELKPATLFKKIDSDTGVFLWILRNFWEHLFLEHLWWLLLNISVIA